MNFSKINIKQYRASNFLALAYMVLPLLLCVSGLYLSVEASSIWLWISGQFILGVFFFQCFILLHETGHYSFFKSALLNRIFGHVFGFLSFIPFVSWVEIHNLHHRWTGWRDKDPTTSDTVSPKYGIVLKTLVNVSWALFLPLFTISYRLSNYWNAGKLAKYISAKKLRAVYVNQAIILAAYILLFYFFGSFIFNYILLAYVFSLMISDLFILSQHSHIEMPLSKGEEVKPLRYIDQLPYTRSIGFNRLVAKLFFFNFNLHEWHHAYPGVPGYYLNKLPENTPNFTPFWQYILRFKKMSGMKFIFSTEKKP